MAIDVVEFVRSKGEDTLAPETDSTRAPIWAPRAGLPVQLALAWDPLPLNGHPFLIRELTDGVLCARDWLLLAHLQTRWIWSGCSSGGIVPFTLAEASRLLGYGKLGGRTRSLVKASIARLRSATFEAWMRLPEGGVASRIWGLIDSARLTSPAGGGGGWVELSEYLQEAIRAQNITLMHGPTAMAIFERDQIAALMWIRFETDELDKPWNYPLFGAAPGQLARELRRAPLASSLRLEATRRTNVKARIEKAFRVLCEVDPRYAGEVVASRGRRGMWYLEVVRSGDPQESAPVWLLGTSRRKQGLSRAQRGTPTSPKRDSHVQKEGLPRDVLNGIQSSSQSSFQTITQSSTESAQSARHSASRSRPQSRGARGSEDPEGTGSSEARQAPTVDPELVARRRRIAEELAKSGSPVAIDQARAYLAGDSVE